MTHFSFDLCVTEPIVFFLSQTTSIVSRLQSSGSVTRLFNFQSWLTSFPNSFFFFSKTEIFDDSKSMIFHALTIACNGDSIFEDFNCNLVCMKHKDWIDRNFTNVFVFIVR